jgi:hypothetical protein
VEEEREKGGETRHVTRVGCVVRLVNGALTPAE